MVSTFLVLPSASLLAAQPRRRWTVYLFPLRADRVPRHPNTQAGSFRLPTLSLSTVDDVSSLPVFSRTYTPVNSFPPTQATPYKLLFSSTPRRKEAQAGEGRWGKREMEEMRRWKKRKKKKKKKKKEEVKVGVRWKEGGRNDSSRKERMFCQAVAERELACQLMGHVQCEPRILQLLSPFLPLSAHFSFIQPRLVSAARISFPLSLSPSLFLSLALARSVGPSRGAECRVRKDCSLVGYWNVFSKKEAHKYLTRTTVL